MNFNFYNHQNDKRKIRKLFCFLSMDDKQYVNNNRVILVIIIINKFLFFYHRTFY